MANLDRCSRIISATMLLFSRRLIRIFMVVNSYSLPFYLELDKKPYFKVRNSCVMDTIMLVKGTTVTVIKYLNLNPRHV